MRGSSFSYLLKEGARNIYSNKQMSIASIGVLVACLLLIGMSMLFSLNVNNFVGYAEQQNEVVAFLYDDLDEQYRSTVEEKFASMPNVASFEYISKEQGLKDWISSMSGVSEDADDLFNPLFEDNVLPDSYYLQIVDLSILAETVRELESINGIESVRAPVEVAQTITSIKQAVTFGGAALVLLLIGVASVIIANTIKITVFNRRKEISIMKYVGATDTFIRLPFVVEGLLLGLLSATIAFLLLWGFYTALLHWLAQNPVSWFTFLVDNMIVFNKIALPMFGGFTLAGVTVGAVGSMIFVRRYLKV